MLASRKFSTSGMDRSGSGNTTSSANQTNPSTRKATFAAIKSDTASQKSFKSQDKSTPRKGPSIAGIMLARRFTKQLSNKVMEKRKEREANQTVAPTYRMEPLKRFDSKKVENAIKGVLEDRLHSMTYNARLAGMLSRVMSEEIKDKVKAFKFDRYKIVCTVTVGEKKDQTMMVASRCSWDPSVDSCSTYSYQNGQMFCTATVYGLYNE